MPCLYWDSIIDRSHTIGLMCVCAIHGSSNGVCLPNETAPSPSVMTSRTTIPQPPSYNLKSYHSITMCQFEYHEHRQCGHRTIELCSYCPRVFFIAGITSILEACNGGFIQTSLSPKVHAPFYGNDIESGKT